ncbi:MAG TPA: DUF998 domain-containing protein [Asticcacaulis sp.]|nr:DUF998 domain-containing protein [Asticcacaulis sp.]
MRNHYLGWCGPAAAVLFGAAVIGFASLRHDGYTHATKAVSELGAMGAENALTFNVLGFIVPGILVILLAITCGRAFSSGFGAFCLVVSGAALTASGLLPADMAHRNGQATVLHGMAAVVSGLAFAIAVFPLGSAMRKTPGFTRLGQWTPWFVLFLLANIGWQIAWKSTGNPFFYPGWGQRIAFAGYFLWMTLAGLALTRPRPA